MYELVLIGGGVAVGTIFGVQLKALWEKYVSPKVEAVKDELEG